MLPRPWLAGVALLVSLPFAQADVTRTTANNGQLVMEDVPPIPQQVVRDLNRYQNVRSARFRAWTLDSSGICVSTRFGDVDQIHHVGHPGGARTQLTFFSEPIRGVSRQPDNSAMAFTLDTGGSEFSQIFLVDPATGAEPRMLSDGESQNGSLVWSRDGGRLAMTLNTPRTPSDSFVLSLGNTPLQYQELTRWTFSEAGGLDTGRFVEPELVSFPTFDSGEGGPESIPAWLYRPAGLGPHPVVISIHGGPEAQARPYFSST